MGHFDRVKREGVRKVGVDLSALDFLLRFRGTRLGETLCLGRQRLTLELGSEVRSVANDILFSRTGRSIEDIESPDGYSEKFLFFLGSSNVSSLDISNFEGSNIIHDMNRVIPSFMENCYDFIFDGGTLEHIYNFPIAAWNVRRMLRVGGLLVSINGANNQLGHGLYQFSPELLWRVFGPPAGFEIEAMELVPITGNAPQPITVPPPDGQRREYGPTQHASYVVCAARKRVENVDSDLTVYQGDYAAAWERALDPPAVHVPPIKSIGSL